MGKLTLGGRYLRPKLVKLTGMKQDNYQKRFFIGIQVPKDISLAISQWRRQAFSVYEHTRWQAVHQNDLHVTLRFLGCLNDKEVNELSTCLSHLPVHFFTIATQALNLFIKPQVLYLSTSCSPSHLHLFDVINQTIAQQFPELNRRIQYTLHASYQPHVSLFRKVKSLPLLDPPPEWLWSVNQFHLYQSQPNSDGSKYQILNSFRLEPKH
ncbi:RNA 2',3'-cyclic phosphodiesterase [Saccharobesus litoralis]|uniref:RNA 2',3'-cyclic phosphodiesterase n=1 Tax=Saccharobesus litoralis TaxID=2172099 RepID=UPI00131F46ED|nr:RNA 2',3'-cyclic phosphodiesterase [Saccharobesus litoralis]